MTKVRLFGTLPQLTGGEKHLEVTPDPPTIEGVLEALERDHSGFKQRILDSTGELIRQINIFVDDENLTGEDIRYLGGLAAPVSIEAKLTFVPAIAGGSEERHD